MSKRLRCLIAIGYMILCSYTMNSQTSKESFSHLDSNAAFTVSVPLESTASYMTPAWGFVYGVGYNFNQRHSIFGEVTWNRLYATASALAPIREASQNNNINGHGNLAILTANYRLQFERHTLGVYFLVGGGLYYRNVALSQPVTTGGSVVCNPAWLWWGFSCSSGTVTENQTLAHTSSTAPGVTGGLGFTVRLPDTGYRFYMETRYHFASNRVVSTRVVPITIGLRF